MNRYAASIAATILTAGTIGLTGTTADAAQPKTWKRCTTSATLNCVKVGHGDRPSYIRWLRNAHDPSTVTLKFVTHDRAVQLLNN
jgi:hypothetical protein